MPGRVSRRLASWPRSIVAGLVLVSAAHALPASAQARPAGGHATAVALPAAAGPVSLRSPARHRAGAEPVRAPGRRTAGRAGAAHRVRAAAPRARLLATVAPSPFVPAHGTARIIVRGASAGGRPLRPADVRVTLRALGSGMRLRPPTAAERRRGVVALVTAGGAAGAAVVVVSATGAAPQTLKLEAYTKPAQLVAGKGAWASFATYGALGARGILRRIAREGVTHLYLETTGLRFVGQAQLDTVLENAHNLGIAVIAWDYASLTDPALEVRSAERTLAFRSALGAHVDGLAGDFEKNLSAGAMRTFSAAVRRALGARRVYVGVIYPPQDGFATPIATMAQYVNVFAPMDYWLSAPRAYTPAEAAAYVTRSIVALRDAPGENNLPIEVVSQTQNVENASGFGLYNPPPAQVVASAKAAEAAGAVGVSFYDLRTQTPAQIAAIAALRVRRR